MIAVLFLAITASTIQVLAWARTRQWGRATLGGVFLFVYLCDLVSVLATGSTYLIPSEGVQAASISSASSATVFLVGTWVVFALFSTRLPGLEADRGRGFGVRTVVLGLTTLLLLAIVAGTVLQAGLTETLISRQRVFSGNVMALLGYFLLPVAALLCALQGYRAGWAGVRLWWYSLAGVGALGSLATGSRSAFILGLLLPLLAFHARELARSRPSIVRDAKRVLLGMLVLAVPLAATVYIRVVRGVSTQSVPSPLHSPDVSQADVMVRLFEVDPEARLGDTYVAALFFAVPRVVWADKPVPGNVIASELLAPDRYALTGSEVTIGMAGEAFLNFGWFGMVVAGAALGVLARVVDHLLRHPDTAVWTLGVIVLLRGINLIRGDAVNAVVPVILTVLLWLAVYTRRTSSEQSTSTGVGRPALLRDGRDSVTRSSRA